MSGPSPIQPAGSPLGFLVPANYALPVGQPDGIAADAIDPTTGEYLSISQGFDPLDAWILGQLAVAKGSGSAVINDGRDYSDIKRATAQDQEIMRQEILRPIQPLIDAGEITASASVEIENDTIVGYLTYKNLSTNKVRDRVAVPSGGLAGVG